MGTEYCPGEPASWTWPDAYEDEPMTHMRRLSIIDGDRVTVEDDHGAVAEYEVKWTPFRSPGGEWVIGLVGMAGWYLLDRVRSIRWVGEPGAEIARLRCNVAHLRDRVK